MALYRVGIAIPGRTPGPLDGLAWVTGKAERRTA
jgi:hypothetical protein